MIIEDIWKLKIGFEHYGMSWVRREANKVAHTMVNLSLLGRLLVA